MSAIRDFLQQRLQAGDWTFGQILVRSDFSLRHAEDFGRADLEIYRQPTDARELAKYDAAGNYRPLKTAPNLRHGWALNLSNLLELQLALDLLYPSALGTWVAWEAGRLQGIPLRDTLGRQTGMYRVTNLITDEQAAGVIDKTCVKGCLRHRLWDIESIAAPTPIPDSAIFCAEACNLLVAACRPVAKQNLPAAT